MTRDHAKSGQFLIGAADRLDTKSQIEGQRPMRGQLSASGNFSGLDRANETLSQRMINWAHEIFAPWGPNCHEAILMQRRPFDKPI